MLLGACLGCGGAEPMGAVERKPDWCVDGLDGSLLRLGGGVALRVDCGRVVDSCVALVCCGYVWSSAVYGVCFGHTGAKQWGR